MSTQLAVTITIAMKEVLSDGSVSGQDKFAVNKTYTFVDAAGVLGSPKVWADHREVTGTESVDVAGGVTDQLGQVETFLEEKLLFVWHKGSTGTVTVGGGSNPAVGLFTGTVPLAADGMLIIINPTGTGGAVVAGTGDLHQLVATVAATPVEIAVAGE